MVALNASLVLGFVLASPIHSNAQPYSPGDACECLNGGSLEYPGTWQVTNKKTTYQTNDLENADNSIGSVNPCPDPIAPTPATCTTSAGTVIVKSWKVTGSIKYGAFGVSGAVGSDQTINYGANCSNGCNNWCQRCHAEAGYEYTEDVWTLSCSGSAGYQCPADVTGTYDHAYAQYCAGQGNIAVGAPCKSSCN